MRLRNPFNLIALTIVIALGMVLTSSAQARYGGPPESAPQHAQRQMKQLQDQANQCAQIFERLRTRYEARIRECLDDDDTQGTVLQLRNCLRSMQRQMLYFEGRMNRTCENACRQLGEMGAPELADQVRLRLRDCLNQVDAACLQVHRRLRDQIRQHQDDAT